MGFLIQAIIFGILNIVSTRSVGLSLLLCVSEYVIVYYLLIRRKSFDAFLYYVLFTSVSFEMDAFVYGLEQPPFVRYSFFNLPGLHDWVYNLTILVFFFRVCKFDKRIIDKDIRELFQWLKILFISGTASIAVGICLNDNNIVGSGLYPKLAVSTILRFSFMCMFFYVCVMFAQDLKVRDKLYTSAKHILLAVAISSLVGLLLGYRGFYGGWSKEVILSPMIFAYTPCLMLFYKKGYSHSYLYLFAAMAVIIASFLNPAYIGSKWFLIIAGTFYAFIYSAMNIQSWKYGVLLLFVMLCMVAVLGLVFKSDGFDSVGFVQAFGVLNSWKLMQAFGAINIFNYSDFEGWFNSLDDSAQFRLDELFNISIEYINKPFYLVCGKGFGGTTLHYTNFENLDWYGDASFTEEQIKNGFFYQMHETLGVIYLRHGLLGIAFFFVVVKMLFKRLNQNPWAMFGLLWFVFFWGWCVSFRLGALALILALAYNSSELSLYEYNKDKN